MMEYDWWLWWWMIDLHDVGNDEDRLWIYDRWW